MQRRNVDAQGTASPEAPPALSGCPKAIFIVAAVLGGWLVNPWLFCLAPAGLYSAWDDYRNIRSLLLSGDVCPTLVLGENPGRVAVLANLSATGGVYPV